MFFQYWSFVYFWDSVSDKMAHSVKVFAMVSCFEYTAAYYSHIQDTGEETDKGVISSDLLLLPGAENIDINISVMWKNRSILQCSYVASE